MKDTVISLSPEQGGRFMQGYDAERHQTPAWDLDAFASAGGIRSTAGDMLTYLEAQLHPESAPFRAALVESQRLRAPVAGSTRIALAWIYDPGTSVYMHNGATGGFTSYTCFDPRRDFAAVVFMNAAPATFPFIESWASMSSSASPGSRLYRSRPLRFQPPAPSVPSSLTGSR
jgi:CubicO group peptidase (beta-lactamase class C family)